MNQMHLLCLKMKCIQCKESKVHAGLSGPGGCGSMKESETVSERNCSKREILILVVQLSSDFPDVLLNCFCKNTLLHCVVIILLLFDTSGKSDCNNPSFL